MHTILHAQEASFEYLENESERTLLEAMDALEVAFSHPLVSWAASAALRSLGLGLSDSVCRPRSCGS